MGKLGPLLDPELLVVPLGVDVVMTLLVVTMPPSCNVDVSVTTTVVAVDVDVELPVAPDDETSPPGAVELPQPPMDTTLAPAARAAATPAEASRERRGGATAAGASIRRSVMVDAMEAQAPNLSKMRRFRPQKSVPQTSRRGSWPGRPRRSGPAPSSSAEGAMPCYGTSVSNPGCQGIWL
jgi:hypothetical protein